MTPSLAPEEGTTPRRRRRKKSAPPPSVAEVRARYDCAFEEEAPAEEGRFAPPQLVWAKVKGHPWWPGQVFDPSDACFGDKTFLWAAAEDLKPFRAGFPDLAKIGCRGSSKATFAPALDDALDEVSRRVDAGLSCGCGAPAPARMKQVVQNSGVLRGVRGAAVDAAFARDALRGEAFVAYVRALAVAPEAGADSLDLAIAAAQMKALRRWRRAADPEHQSTSGVVSGGTVVPARASRWRATTPRRESTRRGLFRVDAPAGDPTLSMCARAAAAADNAFMMHMFSGEALEEYASAMAVTPPPPAGACRRNGLAVANLPQRKAFDERRSAIAACGNAAKNARSTGGDGADADTGICRTVTSCISSGEDSACDDAWETELEDFEPASKWRPGWKDYVIFMQFVAIVLLVCQLME